MPAGTGRQRIKASSGQRSRGVPPRQAHLAELVVQSRPGLVGTVPLQEPGGFRDGTFPRDEPVRRFPPSQVERSDHPYGSERTAWPPFAGPEGRSVIPHARPSLRGEAGGMDVDDPHAPVSLPINHALSDGRREGVVRPVVDSDQPGLTRRSDMRKPPVTWVVPGRKTWWRQSLR